MAVSLQGTEFMGLTGCLGRCFAVESVVCHLEQNSIIDPSDARNSSAEFTYSSRGLVYFFAFAMFLIRRDLCCAADLLQVRCSLYLFLQLNAISQSCQETLLNAPRLGEINIPDSR